MNVWYKKRFNFIFFQMDTNCSIYWKAPSFPTDLTSPSCQILFSSHKHNFERIKHVTAPYILLFPLCRVKIYTKLNVQLRNTYIWDKIIKTEEKTINSNFKIMVMRGRSVQGSFKMLSCFYPSVECTQRSIYCNFYHT